MCLRRLAEIAGLAEIPQSSGRTAESQVIQGIPAEQEGAMHSNAMVATNERPVTLQGLAPGGSGGGMATGGHSGYQGIRYFIAAAR